MSTARAESARVTRRRIRAAALELFRTQGYGATTMPDIASHAGVAVQTLYYTFGTKRALLAEVLDVAVAGDDEPLATMDRQSFREVLEQPDGVRMLARYAVLAEQIHARVAPVLEVVRGAASSDPECAELWTTNRAQHAQVLRRLIAELDTTRRLRPGLSRRDAVDVASVLVSPDSYLLLTRDRGWGRRRWAEWAGAILARELVADGAAPT